MNPSTASRTIRDTVRDRLIAAGEAVDCDECAGDNPCCSNCGGEGTLYVESEAIAARDGRVM